MKKLFLSVMLVAFGLAVQAGEGQSCGDKAACPAGAKKVSAEAKAQCPASAQAKQVKAEGGCCPSKQAKQTTVAKAESPKAAEQAKR